MEKFNLEPNNIKEAVAKLTNENNTISVIKYLKIHPDDIQEFCLQTVEAYKDGDKTGVRSLGILMREILKSYKLEQPKIQKEIVIDGEKQQIERWVSDINMLKLRRTPEEIELKLEEIRNREKKNNSVFLKIILEEIGKKYSFRGRNVEIIFPSIQASQVGDGWYSDLVLRDLDSNTYTISTSAELAQGGVEIKP